MKLNQIALIVLIALCLIVLIQNFQTASLRLLFWSISLPQLLLTLLTLLVGFAVGYLTSTLTRHKKAIKPLT
jgi:uncharacterized integral membrane protein